MTLGANIGYYSLIAASIVGSEGKVYAFEPCPTIYEWLLRNIKLNNYNNIKSINKAASDKKGVAKLYIDSLNIGGHSLLPLETDKYVEVETIPLDEFFRTEHVIPDVIKIDVEGTEFFVLKGMEETISENNKLTLFVEFEHIEKSGITFNFLVKWLKRKGFNVYFITCDGKIIPVEQKIINVNLERNLFCIKEGSDFEGMLLDIKCCRGCREI